MRAGRGKANACGRGQASVCSGRQGQGSGCVQGERGKACCRERESRPEMTALRQFLANYKRIYCSHGLRGSGLSLQFLHLRSRACKTCARRVRCSHGWAASVFPRVATAAITPLPRCCIFMEHAGVCTLHSMPPCPCCKKATAGNPCAPSSMERCNGWPTLMHRHVATTDICTA